MSTSTTRRELIFAGTGLAASSQVLGATGSSAARPTRSAYSEVAAYQIDVQRGVDSLTRIKRTVAVPGPLEVLVKRGPQR